MSWNQHRNFNETSQQSVPYMYTRSRNKTPVQELMNGTSSIRSSSPYYNSAENWSPSSTPVNNIHTVSKPTKRQHQRNNETCVGKTVLWPPPAPPEEDTYACVQLQDEYIQNDTPHNTCYHEKHSKAFEPPPTYIPLRPMAPISQDSSPIYRAQPAADTVKGGNRMSGDQKWPPPRYNTLDENGSRIRFQHDPIYRSKKEKDYAFTEHTIPNSVPTGYKAPPGTQHYY